jgi:hypothetical protein
VALHGFNHLNQQPFRMAEIVDNTVIDWNLRRKVRQSQTVTQQTLWRCDEKPHSHQANLVETATSRRLHRHARTKLMPKQQNNGSQHASRSRRALIPLLVGRRQTTQLISRRGISSLKAPKIRKQAVSEGPKAGSDHHTMSYLSEIKSRGSKPHISSNVLSYLASIRSSIASGNSCYPNKKCMQGVIF